MVTFGWIIKNQTILIIFLGTIHIKRGLISHEVGILYCICIFLSFLHMKNLHSIAEFLKNGNYFSLQKHNYFWSVIGKNGSEIWKSQLHKLGVKLLNWLGKTFGIMKPYKLEDNKVSIS